AVHAHQRTDRARRPWLARLRPGRRAHPRTVRPRLRERHREVGLRRGGRRRAGRCDDDRLVAGRHQAHPAGRSRDDRLRVRRGPRSRAVRLWLRRRRHGNGVLRRPGGRWPRTRRRDAVRAGRTSRGL
ncbi:MAG: hypothetical protein AVDCRST_MAG85-3102, partial [uncultured Solirubrobacteraceae bacterium]